MSYIVYHKETTRFLEHYFRNVHIKTYITEAAAKAAITRAIKADRTYDRSIGKYKAEDFAISTWEEFSKIERTEVVINLMSGKPVTQSVNTPHCCDPSTETYWCM